MGRKSKSKTKTKTKITVTKSKVTKKSSAGGEITLTISEHSAQRLQDEAAGAMKKLDKLVEGRVHVLSKEVGDGVTKVLRESNIEKSEKERVQRRREWLDLYLGARDKLSGLDPEESVRDSLQVIHLRDHLDTLHYLEFVESAFLDSGLQARLESLKEQWNKARKHMAKIEEEMSDVHKKMEEQTESIRQRTIRHFGRRYFEKFDEDVD
ncbi:uncharacterized protein FOMMEDRAFT_29024 [Fomitiporia mediterranea MF3/22]|uniref:uncharacterized protein n=1 Tax=Fomitiporia mediterranea (strain MF3/22) TaxID=694068 RepID=UPI000440808A|nr:uncharacterized protein FOMMEDRAFT_29024 [Fomitiporia mediterranea MF3/22]EJD01875.1 hypothetical protein FOMMEDRAFT_29024 [Fomitiporia mediterranea MF3/22]